MAASASSAPPDVLNVREEVRRQLSECLGQELAASTVHSYQQVLKQVVGEAELGLDKQLLPLQSEDDALELFGHLRLVEGSHGRTLHWSKVRTLKAALDKYHARLGVDSPLSLWPSRFKAFWRGLAKDCVHSNVGKQPVPFDALMDYLQREVHEHAKEVAIRNAAAVVVGYFGVRRGAEIVNFEVTDILEANDTLVRLLVRCQKNDQLGLGQVRVLPDIRALGAASPPRVLRRWLEIRPSLAQAESTKLFITTTGINAGGPMSKDSLRKHVSLMFGKGMASHSLRKGGAVFLFTTGHGRRRHPSTRRVENE